MKAHGEPRRIRPTITMDWMDEMNQVRMAGGDQHKEVYGTATSWMNAAGSCVQHE